MAQKRPNNTRTAVVIAGIAVGMVGMAFASVPLYRIFCQVTGYGGTPVIAEAGSDGVPVMMDRFVTVNFDSNVHPGLAWRFRPLQKSVTVHPGEQKLAFFEATNLTDEPILGQATFNVAPLKAGPYFVKIDCFCFTEQRLMPGQTIPMPVTFYVDPAMYEEANTKEIETITLSYTFFRAMSNDAGKQSDAAAAAVGDTTAKTNDGAGHGPNG